MSAFCLDPQLATQTVFIHQLALSDVLLMNDRRFPWLLLVPRKAPVLREMFELNPKEQQALMQEMAMISKILKDVIKAYKINVATFGNIVPQLHVHIIARYQEDAAWPNSVFGFGTRTPYSETELQEKRTLYSESILSMLAVEKL